MRLSYWKNKFKKGSDRIYLNGAPITSGNKVWIEREGKADFVFKAKEHTVDPEIWRKPVLLALYETGKIPSLDEVTFNDILAAARGGSSEDKSPVDIKPASTRGRDSEASQLDLRSIKVPEPVSIQIDHREPHELVELLSDIENVEVSYGEALDAGDILINGQIVIERKRCSAEHASTDFESSIIDGSKRLFYQSEQIKLMEDKIGIVILEGDAYANSGRMLIQQIDGAISFLAAIQGLSVITTYNLQHTAYLLIKLATHHRSGLGYELGLRAKKPAALIDRQRFLLEGLPGVNAGIAKALLEHFGSVRQVMAASKEELMEVPRIGKTKAQQIIEVMGS